MPGWSGVMTAPMGKIYDAGLVAAAGEIEEVAPTDGDFG